MSVAFCTIILSAVAAINAAQYWLTRDNDPAGYYQSEADTWLERIETDYLHFNRLSAALTWEQTRQPGNESVARISRLGSAKAKWLRRVCEEAEDLEFEYMRTEQQRKVYLLCREPSFSETEMSELTRLQDSMYAAYTTTEVCLDANTCMTGEPDLERLMSFRNSTPELLLWAWEGWYNSVGPKIKQFYPDFIRLMNAGARRKSYSDIGEVWREELEVADLPMVVMDLYTDVKPLYQALHAVVRFRLHQKYGSDLIDPYGPLPAHLLGNMWAQDWSSLLSILIDTDLDLDQNIKQRKWSVHEMVLKAEDFYTSMHLPPMTQKFWNNSRFVQADGEVSCHGTAANMFTSNDFRILMCADLTMTDFYVMHHEMGHIEYYMAYSDQSPLFQEGANSAFQEAIGDAVMLGVMSPLHLHRLGLLNDRQLTDKATDIYVLLNQALAKIPQIPYALLIDKYRWDVFSGAISRKEFNKKFWRMNEQLRGIKAPSERSEHYFDAGAKFHVPDNTPYIRYFLSYILQMQFFKGMCELSVYGKLLDTSPGHVPMPFPLHRCDIYGSKKAGRKLTDMLELGSSEPWNRQLPILTGSSLISPQALLEYFEPIHKWLRDQIKKYNIPEGW